MSDYKKMTRSLMRAALNGDLPEVQRLVPLVGVGTKGSLGVTALHRAALGGHLPVIEWLCQHGADVNTGDSRGWTALHLAAGHGHLPVIECLCQHGADVNRVDNMGITPLIVAAKYGQASAVSTLLTLGADPTVRDRWNKTALDRARGENSTEVVRVLQEWGSRTSGGQPKHQAGRQIGSRTSGGQPKHQAGRQIGNFSKLKVELAGSTPRQRREYARTNCMRILSAGNQGNGKSTLLNTLLRSKPSLTDESDRTEVANFGIWVPDGTKMKVISMVDLGGHDSYQATGHFFHRNGSANVVVLCHDILSSQYDETFNWMESIIYTSPSSHIEFILTKIDMIEKEEDRQQQQEAFLNKLELYLKEQCELLKDSVVYAQQHKLDEDHKMSIEEALRKYEMLRDNMESCTHLISCVEGFDKTVDKVKERLLELSERPGSMVYLEESHQRLYEELGKVGLDVPQMKQTDEPISTAAKAKSSKKPFLKKMWDKVKSKTQTQSKAVQDKVEASNSQASPMQRTQYATLDEAVAVFKAILTELGLTTEAVEEQTKEALAKLSDHGFLIYFRDSQRLSNVVFNDLKTFVNVLKCIFHHQADEFLQSNSSDELVKKHFGFENAEKQFHAEIKRLRDNGLMTPKLLQFLLDKSNCAIDSNTVMELLDKVDVGYLFRPQQIAEAAAVSEENSDPLVFIPYFVNKKEQKDVDLTLFQDIEHSDIDQLSLTVKMTGRVKKPFFDYLVVRLYERLYPYRATQKLIMHRCGFHATLGKHDIRISLTMPRKGEIKFVVKGSVKTLEGHRTIFEFFKYFDEDSTVGMRKWWRGMPGKKVFICTNCSPSKCERCVSNVLKETHCNQMIFCEGSNVQIPSALVFPLSANEAEATEQLEHLREYLSFQFKKTPVSPKVEGVQNPVQSGHQHTHPRVSGRSTEQQSVDSIKHSSEATKPSFPSQAVESVEDETVESTRPPQITESGHCINWASEFTASSETGESIQTPTVTSETTSPAQIAVVDTTDQQDLAMAQPTNQVLRQVERSIQRHMAHYAIGLSHQMFHQGQALSNQMSTQDRGMRDHIHRAVALDVGNASTVDLQCEQSALRACQEDLVENMDIDEELLDECVTSGILTQSEKDIILNDQNRIGKAKRLLIKVDQYGRDGPKILSKALQKSGEGNKILGKQLSDALHRDDSAPSVM